MIENKASSRDSREQPVLSRRVEILGVKVDGLDMNESLGVVKGFIDSGKPHYVVTPNLNFVALADKNEAFRKAINQAHLCTADGVPLLWISRLKRAGLKERVNGTDFVHALCRILSSTPNSIFLLGTTDEIAAAAARRLEDLYPGLIIAGRYSPPLGDFDDAENSKMREEINHSGASVVFVALGSPKQELWMADNYSQLGACACIGIGGSLDFIGGAIKRAPRWMQKSGLEWLFRIIVEPKRLAGRYARDLIYIIKIFVKHSMPKKHW